MGLLLGVLFGLWARWATWLAYRIRGAGLASQLR